MLESGFTQTIISMLAGGVIASFGNWAIYYIQRNDDKKQAVAADERHADMLVTKEIQKYLNVNMISNFFQYHNAKGIFKKYRKIYPEDVDLLDRYLSNLNTYEKEFYDIELKKLASNMYLCAHALSAAIKLEELANEWDRGYEETIRLTPLELRHEIKMKKPDEYKNTNELLEKNLGAFLEAHTGFVKAAKIKHMLLPYPNDNTESEPIRTA